MTGVKTLNMPGRLDAAGFRLKLGPTLWHLIGTKSTGDWLARYARILELEPWRPAPEETLETRKLFFLSGRDSAPGSNADFPSLAAAAGLPAEGWTSHFLNPVFIRTHPGSQDIVLEIRSIDQPELAVQNMVKSCYALFESIVTGGGLVLHAALVEKNGLGVALAASGGAGKSTCARRIPAPWKALCDDTCLILPDGRGGFQVHPFATWSDYIWNRSQGTWKVESHVPLRAIFFLKKAEEDKALPLGQGESAVYLSRFGHDILSGFLRSIDRAKARSLRQTIFANACSLRQTVPAYWLEVELGGQFWTEMEKALS